MRAGFLYPWWLAWMADRGADRREILVGPLAQIVVLEGAYERVWPLGSGGGRAWLLYDDPNLMHEVDRLRRDRDERGAL